MMTKSTFITASVAMLSLLIGSASVRSHDEPGARPHHIDVPANATAVMRAFSQGKLDDEIGVQDLAALATTTCSGGFADIYPCENVDLMSFMPLASIGATQSNDEANDIWGWTDPDSGREFAIIGRVFGTSFVDISDPANPVFIGELDTHGRFGSPWRDIKVYADHAFIVSEARRHGMQVFDLTQLLDVPPADMPVLFQETAHYRGFGSAHNIVINEDSGYAYGVGTDQCAGGLEMVNIQNPRNPTGAGCFDSDGYTHDAQCVIYTGPDPDHQGAEICMASNEDTLTIVDVSDKSNPVQISRTSYDGASYTHQGWFTEDQVYFLLDDELDEQDVGHNTRTRVFDASDLAKPVFVGSYDSGNAAIDHNQYVKGNFVYQANYRSGLRILDLSGVSTASLTEVAYFDIYPADDAAQFNAAWSNYPYFDSGVVIVSGIEQGLFVLRPNLGPVDDSPTVSVTDPAEGATVSGTSVTLAANAGDDNGVIQVDFFVDGNLIGTDTNPPYTLSWDSFSVADGVHAVSATATDTVGQTSSDSNNVTVDNVSNPTMHVGGLDGSSVAGGQGGKWDATVTITVHDSAEMPVNSATVSGAWSAGANGSGSCVTNATGRCDVVRNNIKRNSASVTFTVTGVTHPSFSYDDSINHDFDGDSNGTAIVIASP